MRLKTWHIHLLVIASYALFASLVFAPLWGHWGSAIGTRGGIPDDGWMFVWMLKWFHDAVSSGHNPFFTPLLFYPHGADLFWQTLTSPNGLLALPLIALGNAIAAFNTLAWLTFVFSGYTMFLLARHFVPNYGAAWVAGLLFAFSPFHLSKLYDGQVEMMSIQYFPLLVLWLVYALDGRRWRYALLVGGLMVWITLTSLYYGLFSLIYLGLYALLVIIRRHSWRAVWDVARGGLIGVVPLLLVLLPHVIGYQAGDDLPDWRIAAHAATPLDFVLPSPYNPLWGSAIARVQAAIHPGVGAINISLGLMVLLLAGLGLWWCRKQVWSWAMLAVALFVLALGPTLVLNNQSTNIPLPYKLLMLLPAVKLGQRPNHIIVIASVLLCLLAAHGWHVLLGRVTRQRRGLVVGGLLLCLALDLWPQPLEVAAFQIPPFYRQIPPATGGAILELPFDLDGSGPLQAQMVHGRPLLGGYLARTPPYPFTAYTDGIQQLWSPQMLQSSIIYNDWRDAVVPTLAAYNIEYVVIHKDKLAPQIMEQLDATLRARLAVAYDDGELIAFQRPAAVPQPLLSLGAGWYGAEQAGARRWQWSGPTAEFVLMNPAATAADVVLEARLETPNQAQAVALDQQRGMQWTRVLTLAGSPLQRTVRVPLRLAPGQSVMRWSTLATTERGEQQPPRVLGASFTQLRLLPLVSTQATAMQER